MQMQTQFIEQVRDALLAALNLESDATYGAARRAQANPTDAPLDVAHHTDRIREALNACDRMQARAPKARKPKAEKEFKPLVYTRRLQDGTTEECELDGVSVDKAVRKLMAGIAARGRADGRAASVFEALESLSTTDYVKRFCNRLHHVAAPYTTDK